MYDEWLDKERGWEGWYYCTACHHKGHDTQEVDCVISVEILWEISQTLPPATARRANKISEPLSKTYSTSENLMILEVHCVIVASWKESAGVLGASSLLLRAVLSQLRNSWANDWGKTFTLRQSRTLFLTPSQLPLFSYDGSMLSSFHRHSSSCLLTW